HGEPLRHGADNMRHHVPGTPPRTGRRGVPLVVGHAGKDLVEERQAVQERFVNRRRCCVVRHTSSMTPATDNVTPKRHAQRCTPGVGSRIRKPLCRRRFFQCTDGLHPLALLPWWFPGHSRTYSPTTRPRHAISTSACSGCESLSTATG